MAETHLRGIFMITRPDVNQISIEEEAYAMVRRAIDQAGKPFMCRDRLTNERFCQLLDGGYKDFRGFDLTQVTDARLVSDQTLDVTHSRMNFSQIADRCYYPDVYYTQNHNIRRITRDIYCFVKDHNVELNGIKPYQHGAWDVGWFDFALDDDNVDLVSAVLLRNTIDLDGNQWRDCQKFVVALEKAVSIENGELAYLSGISDSEAQEYIIRKFKNMSALLEIRSIDFELGCFTLPIEYQDTIKSLIRICVDRKIISPILLYFVNNAKMPLFIIQLLAATDPSLINQVVRSDQSFLVWARENSRHDVLDYLANAKYLQTDITVKDPILDNHHKIFSLGHKLFVGEAEDEGNLACHLPHIEENILFRRYASVLYLLIKIPGAEDDPLVRYCFQQLLTDNTLLNTSNTIAELVMQAPISKLREVASCINDDIFSTVLISFVKSNNLAAVNKLLTIGVLPYIDSERDNWSDDDLLWDSNAAFYWAKQSGSCEMIRMLLNHSRVKFSDSAIRQHLGGEYVNPEEGSEATVHLDESEMSAIILNAVKEGDEKAVESLIAKIPLFTPSWYMGLLKEVFQLTYAETNLRLESTSFTLQKAWNALKLILERIYFHDKRSVSDEDQVMHQLILMRAIQHNQLNVVSILAKAGVSIARPLISKETKEKMDAHYHVPVQYLSLLTLTKSIHVFSDLEDLAYQGELIKPGYSILDWAAERGRWDMVNVMLDSNTLASSDLPFVLACALRNQQKRLVPTLVKHCASLKGTLSKSIERALMTLAEQDGWHMIELFLKEVHKQHGKVESCQLQYRYLFLSALKKLEAPTISLLIKLGFPVFSSDHGEESMICYAAKRKQWAGFELLLDVSPYICIEDLVYPLHLAIVDGQEHIVKRLIGMGVSTSRAGEENLCSDLHNAAKRGDIKHTEFLLGQGVSLFAKTRAGHDAVYYAKSAGNYHVVDLLLKSQLKQYLSNVQARLDRTDFMSRGLTVFKEVFNIFTPKQKKSAADALLAVMSGSADRSSLNSHLAALQNGNLSVIYQRWEENSNKSEAILGAAFLRTQRA